MGSLTVIGLRAVGPGLDGRETTLVSDVSFVATPGAAVFLLGPDDAGGPVVLDVLSGRLRAAEGSIELHRRPDERRLDPEDQDARRQEILDCRALAPLVDRGVRSAVLESATYGATRRRGIVLDASTVASVAKAADVAPDAERSANPFETLRKAIAFGAALRPSVLLAHVPWRGLDDAERRLIVGTFRRALDSKVACVVATQDEALAAATADLAILMFDGVPTAEGPPSEVLPAAFDETRRKTS
jgi:energy-coupling factor transport system ATP-binding protein